MCTLFTHKSLNMPVQFKPRALYSVCWPLHKVSCGSVVLVSYRVDYSLSSVDGLDSILNTPPPHYACQRLCERNKFARLSVYFHLSLCLSPDTQRYDIEMSRPAASSSHIKCLQIRNTMINVHKLWRTFLDFTPPSHLWPSIVEHHHHLCLSADLPDCLSIHGKKNSADSKDTHYSKPGSSPSVRQYMYLPNKGNFPALNIKSTHNP